MTENQTNDGLYTIRGWHPHQNIELFVNEDNVESTSAVKRVMPYANASYTEPPADKKMNHWMIVPVGSDKGISLRNNSLHARDLLAHYEFEGNGKNTSGTSRNIFNHGKQATVAYEPSYPNDIYRFDGQTATFDGVDDYLALGYQDLTNHSETPDFQADFTQGVSVFTWVRPVDATHRTVLYLKSSSNEKVILSLYNGLVECMIGWSGGYKIYRTAGTTIPIDAWTQVGVAIDASEQKAFINGLPFDFRPYITSGPGVLQMPQSTSWSEAWIGKGLILDYDAGGEITTHFKGALDDLKIFENALDQAMAALEVRRTRSAHHFRSKITWSFSQVAFRSSAYKEQYAIATGSVKDVEVSDQGTIYKNFEFIESDKVCQDCYHIRPVGSSLKNLNTSALSKGLNEIYKVGEQSTEQGVYTIARIEDGLFPHVVPHFADYQGTKVTISDQTSAQAGVTRHLTQYFNLPGYKNPIGVGEEVAIYPYLTVAQQSDANYSFMGLKPHMTPVESHRVLLGDGANNYRWLKYNTSTGVMFRNYVSGRYALDNGSSKFWQDKQLNGYHILSRPNADNTALIERIEFGRKSGDVSSFPFAYSAVVADATKPEYTSNSPIHCASSPCVQYNARLVFEDFQTFERNHWASLLAYYPVDLSSGSSLIDHSFHRRPATIATGAQASSAGDELAVLDFDGINGSVTLPDYNVDWAKGFTFSGWIKFGRAGSTDSRWERIFELGQGERSENVVFAREGTTNNLSFEVFDGSVGGHKLVFPSAIEPGKWMFLALTVDGQGNTTIYKNGVNTKVSGTTLAPNKVTRGENYLGQSSWTVDKLFRGSMDDLRFYNVALSEDDINRLWNERKMAYMTIAHYPIEANEGTELKDHGPYARDGQYKSGATLHSLIATEGDLAIAQFDGTQDYARLPPMNTIDFNTGFTFAGWVKFGQQSTAWQRIFELGDGSTKNALNLVRMNATDINLHTLNPGFIVNESFTNFIENDTWTFVVVTLDQGTLKVYKNGVLHGGARSGITMPLNAMRSQNYLGKSTWTGNPYFDGNMDNIRFFDIALDNLEIQNMHNLEKANYPGTPQSRVAATNDLEEEGMVDEAAFVLYPNPTDKGFQVDFHLKEAGTVKIVMTDLSGRVMLMEAWTYDTAGNHSIEISDLKSKGFSSGIYLVEVQSSDLALKQEVRLVLD